MKHHSYFYFDETNDDFANTGIEGKQITGDYQYLPKNLLYRITKPLAYYFFLGILVGILRLGIGTKYVNRKALRNRDKKKGYFIYGNHTSFIPDTVSAAELAFPRQCYTIANPDAVSIKGAGTLVKMFGALPTPEKIKSYRNLLGTIEKLYEKGCIISIFPEAHIWPKYNKIRKFSDVSFTYPVVLDAPCFVKTLVYKKKKSGKTKPVFIIDGPFYPNKELSKKAAKLELAERVYNQMQKRAEEYGSSLDIRYSYTKVDSKNKVRTEIF